MGPCPCKYVTQLQLFIYRSTSVYSLQFLKDTLRHGNPILHFSIHFGDQFAKCLFKECGCYPSLLYPPARQVLFDVGLTWAKKRAHQVKAENDGKDVINHVFSCELAPVIQKWIKLAHTPGVLVADIGDMQKPLVQDILTGKLVARPFATVAYCGWVCHQAYLG